MKYRYAVKYNGVIYPAGYDVPDGKENPKDTGKEENKPVAKPTNKK